MNLRLKRSEVIKKEMWWIVFVKINKVPVILCFESVTIHHVKQLSSWGLVIADNMGHESRKRWPRWQVGPPLQMWPFTMTPVKARYWDITLGSEWYRMGEGTGPLRVAIIVKRAWNNTDESNCSKNAPPYLGHFLSNRTINIPSTLAANIARFSYATSPTKSKQRAKNAPSCSPINPTGIFWSRNKYR